MQRIRMSALSAISIAVGLLASIEAGCAQSVGSYRCEDGTHFIIGFYPHDPRAFMQVDGGEVILRRRLTWSGVRYAGAGVTLTVTKDGLTRIRHAKRPAALCQSL